MAEVRVGLGALFLAPKRRFMVVAWLIVVVWCGKSRVDEGMFRRRSSDGLSSTRCRVCLCDFVALWLRDDCLRVYLGARVGMMCM
jgi:hypothetical protein